MDMENNLPLTVANRLFSDYLHFIGQKMPYPYYELEITSMTVEKDKIGTGYTVMLSHDEFDGVLPDDKAPSIQIDLLSYLDIPVFL